jgi:RNA recognition motif-containing protein
MGKKEIAEEEGKMNIYVGNLSYDLTDEELQHAFEEFGKVDSAKVIKDMYSGRSRGFGFVEMPSEDEANSAIEGLNEKELKGRVLKVNKARPRSEGRGGRGGRKGGGRRW